VARSEGQARRLEGRDGPLGVGNQRADAQCATQEVGRGNSPDEWSSLLGSIFIFAETGVAPRQPLRSQATQTRVPGPADTSNPTPLSQSTRRSWSAFCSTDTLKKVARPCFKGVGHRLLCNSQKLVFHRFGDGCFAASPPGAADHRAAGKRRLQDMPRSAIMKSNRLSAAERKACSERRASTKDSRAESKASRKWLRAVCGLDSRCDDCM